MAGTTVSSSITNEVTLGYGVYLSPLSITSTGEIDNALGFGLLISDIANGTLVNSGSIIGIGDGIYLSQASATIVNSGSIAGTQIGIDIDNFTSGQALILNSGTLTGAFGIAGQEANITNSGYIAGAITGIKLQISTIVNTGTITGQEGVYSGDGSLINHGSIHGDSTGIYLQGGEAENFGVISGYLSTGARVQDQVGGGVTIAGSLVNYGGISGGNYGVYAGSGSFTNHGSITGRIGLAVGIGGAAGNAGSIYGSAYGAKLFGQPNMSGGASLTNTGSISGHLIGVTLGLNAVVTNSGTIYGQNYGVAVGNGYLKNAGQIVNAVIGVTLSGTLAAASNTGTITALTDGVAMSGGLVTNYGTIYGAVNGAFLSGGSLANSGSISGMQTGMAIADATVTNYGLIASADYGMTVERGMVTNAGTISGALGAIEGQFITLIVDPGAAFIGEVANASGKSLLELAGAAPGTLGGIGTQFTGFSDISFATGSQWSIEGNEAGLSLGKTIAGFAKGDTITLDGFSASSAVYVRNVGLEIANAGGTVTLDIIGNFSTGNFSVTETANKTIIVSPTCFLRGTRIATPDGAVAVEALKIGDPVNTLNGARPVKWIGQRSYGGRFIRGNKAMLPICIKSGAIADGVPARDLYVSPGHSISIDNVLVHAARLVNGVSVVQEDAGEDITYFHIELENHEILIAENCPAESFMGESFRPQFQNAGEFAMLYPGDTAPSRMCQPRLDSGFQLFAIQRRIKARAGLAEVTITGKLRGYVDSVGPQTCCGWAQDEAVLDRPVSLDVFCNAHLIGRVLANLYRADVASAGLGDGYQGFEFVLPAGIAGKVEVRRSVDGSPLALAAAAAAEAA